MHVEHAGRARLHFRLPCLQETQEFTDKLVEGASGRLIAHSERSDIPTRLIDFGSVSVDITIFDKQLIVTGTVSGGDAARSDSSGGGRRRI